MISLITHSIAYLDTLPVDEVVEELRHLGWVFLAGETPELGEGKLVKAEEEQVPKDHVQSEVAAQDTAGHIVVVVLQKHAQRILVTHAAVQNLAGGSGGGGGVSVSGYCMCGFTRELLSLWSAGMSPPAGVLCCTHRSTIQH